MPDGSTPKSFLVTTLDRIEALLDRKDDSEAIALLSVARTRAQDVELLASPNSSRPMDVLNDVACLIDSIRGITDLMTEAEPENLGKLSLARLGYAIDGILERAQDRIIEAKEVANG